MKFHVWGTMAGGGWGGNFDAESPDEALVKALAHEKEQGYLSTEIYVTEADEFIHPNGGVSPGKPILASFKREGHGRGVGQITRKF